MKSQDFSLEALKKHWKKARFSLDIPTFSDSLKRSLHGLANDRAFKAQGDFFRSAKVTLEAMLEAADHGVAVRRPKIAPPTPIMGVPVVAFWLGLMTQGSRCPCLPTRYFCLVGRLEGLATVLAGGAVEGAACGSVSSSSGWRNEGCLL